MNTPNIHPEYTEIPENSDVRYLLFLMLVCTGGYMTRDEYKKLVREVSMAVTRGSATMMLRKHNDLIQWGKIYRLTEQEYRDIEWDIFEEQLNDKVIGI